MFADIDEVRVVKSSEDSKKLATNPDYQARAYALDVTQAQSVDALIEKTVKEFGRIDYLINCAGVSRAH